MSRIPTKNSVVLPDSPSNSKENAYVLKPNMRQRTLASYVHVNQRKQLGSGKPGKVTWRGCIAQNARTVGHYGTVTLGIWKADGKEVAVKEIDKAKYSSLVALRNEVRIMQVRGNCLLGALLREISRSTGLETPKHNSPCGHV